MSARRATPASKPSPAKEQKPAKKGASGKVQAGAPKKATNTKAGKGDKPAKPPARKKSAAKTAEPKKTSASAAEPKKSAAAEPKRTAAAEPRRASAASAAEPKKSAAKAAEPRKKAPAKAAELTRAAEPVVAKKPKGPAASAPGGAEDGAKMKPSTEERPAPAPAAAVPQDKPRVLRIAAGSRTPNVKKGGEGSALAKDGRPVVMARRDREPRRGPKVEINPRLESSKGKITAPAPAEGEKKEKPMSVAQKNRAAAEAAFQRVATPIEARPEPAAPANGAAPHKSAFEMRISERDSLTTTLRLADKRDVALAAARELAQRFQLPPDQGLLVKVITLGEPGLAKLALEELLELDDRGRVRRTPDLQAALANLRSDDRETTELKDLLLEKIGAFPG